MVLPLVAVLLGAAPDVGAALALLSKPAGLPELKSGALVGRPGASDVVVEPGFVSWREATTTELVVLQGPKQELVAMLSEREGETGARLRAWRLKGTEVREAPGVLSGLPGLEAFVAPPDVALVPNLTDDDVTPWVTRVVKLPREGQPAEVHYLAAALERECAKGREAQAPELLCRNVAALKYASRRASWDRASARFKPVKAR